MLVLHPPLHSASRAVQKHDEEQKDARGDKVLGGHGGDAARDTGHGIERLAGVEPGVDGVHVRGGGGDAGRGGGVTLSPLGTRVREVDGQS